MLGVYPDCCCGGESVPNNASGPSSSLPPTTLLDLTGHITPEDNFYFAHGGSADIWKGTWVKDTEKRKVCLESILFCLVHVPNQHRQGCCESRSGEQRK